MKKVLAIVLIFAGCGVLGFEAGKALRKAEHNGCKKGLKVGAFATSVMLTGGMLQIVPSDEEMDQICSQVLKEQQ